MSDPAHSSIASSVAAWETEQAAALNEVERLKAVPDDESQPYKSLYAAADVLGNLQQQASALLASSAGHECAMARHVALLALRRGLVLLETDLTHEGEHQIEAGLSHAWAADDLEGLVLRQAAANALGALYCERSAFERAQTHLQQAEELYAPIRARSDSTGAATQASSTGGAEAGCSADLLGRAEAQYTTTLFFRAQVHLHQGEGHASSLYCAATLNRQLQSGGFGWRWLPLAGSRTATPVPCRLTRPGVSRHTPACQPAAAPHAPTPPIPACSCPTRPDSPPSLLAPAGTYDLNDWVQNALQLSNYFLSIRAFALSQYCLAAADAVVRRAAAGQARQRQAPGEARQQAGEAGAGEGQQEQAGGVEGGVGRQQSDEQGRGQGQQQSEGQQERPQHSAQCAGVGGHSAEPAPHSGDGEHSQQPPSQQEPPPPSPQLLDADVAANVALAWAQHDLARLVASHKVTVEGQELELSHEQADDMPHMLRWAPHGAAWTHRPCQPPPPAALRALPLLLAAPQPLLYVHAHPFPHPHPSLAHTPVSTLTADTPPPHTSSPAAGSTPCRACQPCPSCCGARARWWPRLRARGRCSTLPCRALPRPWPTTSWMAGSRSTCRSCSTCPTCTGGVGPACRWG